jgi:uncharacterized protein
MEILERIKNEIAKIEATGIEVLYACESGSRAWGFESMDSDFDVRFIYAQPQEKYLSVFDFKDTMSFPIDDLLDLDGWDLKKSLRLFSGNNMSVFEWVNSPIVYHERQDFRQELKPLEDLVFSPTKAVGHYLGTAKSTWNKHLTKKDFNIKKLFYALRPLLACRWILKYQKMAPVRFQDMLIDDLVAPSIKARILQLIDEKKNLTEKDSSTAYEDLRQYVQSEIDLINQLKLDKPSAIDQSKIDNLFRSFF